MSNDGDPNNPMNYPDDTDPVMGRGTGPRKKPNILPAAYIYLLPRIQEIAVKHGYAIALHGSLAKDLDVIAVPWDSCAAPAQTMIDAIKKQMRLYEASGDSHSVRAHGRKTWALQFTHGPYLDISVMPRACDMVSHEIDADTRACADRYRDLRALDFSFVQDREGYGVSSGRWGNWPDTDREKDIMIDAMRADYRQEGKL